MAVVAASPTCPRCEMSPGHGYTWGLAATSRYYRYYRSEFWTRNSFETRNFVCSFGDVFGVAEVVLWWEAWYSMIDCMRQKSLVRILWSGLFLQKRPMFHVIWRCNPHFPKVQEGYEEFAIVPVLMSCCIKVMWKTHIYIYAYIYAYIYTYLSAIFLVPSVPSCCGEVPSLKNVT